MGGQPDLYHKHEENGRAYLDRFLFFFLFNVCGLWKLTRSTKAKKALATCEKVCLTPSIIHSVILLSYLRFPRNIPYCLG